MSSETAKNNRAYCRAYRQRVKADPTRLAHKRQYDALASKRYRLRKKQRDAVNTTLTTEQIISRIEAGAKSSVCHEPLDLEGVLAGLAHLER
jgi:hypothetical protein